MFKTHRITPLALTALVTLSAGAAQNMMSHSGKFHALHAPTSGTAILHEAGGKATLELKGFKTEVGPDLQVWLYQDTAPMMGAKDATIAKGKYVKVGELKKFGGNFTFEVPAGTKVSDYKSVVIWCEQVQTAFGAAPLN